MRTNFFIGAFITLIAVSCAKETQTEPIVGLAVSASVEQPCNGTKTSLDGLSVSWSVGDKIALYDENGQSAIYQAITAGKTTKFSFVSGSETLSGDVYAYYPGDKVTGFNNGVFTTSIPALQPFMDKSFADGASPMTAKSTVSGDNVSFNFKNVFAVVKLPLTGDGEILNSLLLSSNNDLCGTATIAVDDNGIGTASVSGNSTITLNGGSTVLSSSSTPFFIAVPASEGNNLTITTNTTESTSNAIRSKSSSTPVTTVRNVIFAYDPLPIQGLNKIADVELPANCYMIDASSKSSLVIPLSQVISGWALIDAFDGTTTDVASKLSTEETLSVSSRWIDEDTGSITGTVVSLASPSSYDAILLNMSNCSNGTNAVVDLKNGDEILWSWHLWFTNYAPAASQEDTHNGQVHNYGTSAFSGGYAGKVMMDRNLGATIQKADESTITQPQTKEEAYSTFGLLYQFGRKDPFSSSSSTLSLYFRVGNPVTATYADAARKPSFFFGCEYDGQASFWNKSDAESDGMNDSWNAVGAKSAFDPCPAGWRIPSNENTYNVYSGAANEWLQKVNDIQATAGLVILDKTTSEQIAWIPASAQMLNNNHESAYRHDYAGVYLRLWHASCPTCIAYARDGAVNFNYPYKTSRMAGNPTRCIKE